MLTGSLKNSNIFQKNFFMMGENLFSILNQIL